MLMILWVVGGGAAACQLNSSKDRFWLSVRLCGSEWFVFTQWLLSAGCSSLYPSTRRSCHLNWLPDSQSVTELVKSRPEGPVIILTNGIYLFKSQGFVSIAENLWNQFPILMSILICHPHHPNPVIAEQPNTVWSPSVPQSESLMTRI